MEEPPAQEEQQPSTEQEETKPPEQTEQSEQTQADQQTSAQQQTEQPPQQEQSVTDQTKVQQEQTVGPPSIEEQAQATAKASGALSERDRQVFESALESSGVGRQRAAEIPPDPTWLHAEDAWSRTYGPDNLLQDMARRTLPPIQMQVEEQVPRPIEIPPDPTQLHYDPNIWSRIYGFEGLDEMVKRTQPPSEMRVGEEIVKEATESESQRGHFLREWLESLGRYLFGTTRRTAITLGVIGGVTAIALTGYVQRRKVRRDVEQQLAKQRAIAAAGLPNRSYTPTAVKVQADVYADYYDQQAGPYVAQNYGFGRSEITVNRYRR